MAPELVDVATGAVARCVAGTGVESVALESDPPECGCASLPVGADPPGDEGDEEFGAVEFGAEELDAVLFGAAPPPVDAVGGAEVSTAGPVGKSGCPLAFDAVRGVTELPAGLALPSGGVWPTES